MATDTTTQPIELKAEPTTTAPTGQAQVTPDAVATIPGILTGAVGAATGQELGDGTQQLVPAETPVPEPTVETSEPIRETVASDQEQLATMQQQLLEASEQLKSMQSKQTTEAQPAAPTGELDTRIDQEQQQTDPFAGIQSQINAQQAAIDAELDGQMGLLDDMNSRFDATAARKIDAIKANFDRRRAQQQQITKIRLAGLTTMGIRSGRQRFAGEIQSGILAAEERAGIQALADLDAQEQQLIADAMDANDSQNFELLRDRMSLVRQTRLDKQDVADRLLDNAMKQERLMMDKARAAREQFAFEVEQQDLEIENLASQLVGASDDEILAVAQEMGIPAGRLLEATKSVRRDDRRFEREEEEFLLRQQDLRSKIAERSRDNVASPGFSDAKTESQIRETALDMLAAGVDNAQDAYDTLRVRFAKHEIDDDALLALVGQMYSTNESSELLPGQSGLPGEVPTGTTSGATTTPGEAFGTLATEAFLFQQPALRPFFTPESELQQFKKFIGDASTGVEKRLKQ